MGKYENSICQAVGILIDQAVLSLKLDKTVLGTIYSCIDIGLGAYKVKYQDSVFTAYAQNNTKYKNGTSVYVLIPSNDINKDRIILGTVDKLGEAYMNAATAEDKMTKIGNNIFSKSVSVNFGLCSYKQEDIYGYEGQELINQFGISAQDLKLYKQNSKYLMIAANFQTQLENKQQIGNGDYGLVVTCKYYNDDTKAEYIRKYTINVPNMMGQPYKFVVPSRQYGLFEIEGDNLVSIESVYVYSRNFPIIDSSKEDVKDILVSNFEFYFMEELNEEEIAGVSLHLVTPKGAYFSKTDSVKKLLAEIKIKGAAIDYTNTQDIEYYWFIRDAAIDSDSEKYSPLAGAGWKCLNQTSQDSKAFDGEESFTTFLPGVYELTITKDICTSKENRFKCIALMDDTVLYGELDIINYDYAYNIELIGSEENFFPFETAYNFNITANITNSDGEIINDVIYYWGYEADGHAFETIEVEDDTSNILYHDPNIAINIIRYIVTIYDNTNKRLGCAEIVFTNTKDQKTYNLVLANDTQVFKYNEEGVSPISNSLEKKDRQVILPLTWELYDKYSRIVAQTPYEKIKLFNAKWLLPVEDTMLTYPLFPEVDLLPQMIYNGVNYYVQEIIDTAQLTLNYSIANKYNINYKNNNIILILEYQGLSCIAMTNFTFTKEGELGTNGTMYTAHIEPAEDVHGEIQKVYIHNNKVRYWVYDDEDAEAPPQVYEHSRRFNIEVWGGGNQVEDTNDCTWEVIPRQYGIEPDEEKYNVIFEKQQSEYLIKSTSQFHEQSTILQGYVSTNSLSDLAFNYYATYSLPIEETENPDIMYIITGGYDQVVYSVDGSRARFDDIVPFHLQAINFQTHERIELNENEIEWAASWKKENDGTQIIDEGNDVIIEPPKKLQGELNNYIVVTYNNDTIIWSVNFYFNRYSMAAMNGWDGTGIEVNEDKGYVMTPQLAAGKKSNSDNTFTGIAIGRTFSKADDSNEIGLFGYKDNTRTIFLDAKTGSATFGINDGAHGCLQIIPSSTDDKVTLTSGNFQRATYKTDIDGKHIDVPGQGVEMEFSTKNPHIYFGNGNFEIDKNGNVFLNGTIQAKQGKVGGWTIYNGSLKSNTISIDSERSSISASNNTIIRKDTAILEQLIEYGTDFNSDGSLTQDWEIVISDLMTKFPTGENKNYVDIIKTDSKRGTDEQKDACNKIIDQLQISYSDWYIRGDGSFKFQNADGTNYIKFENNQVKIQANLQGSDSQGRSWYINKDGSANLAKGNLQFDSTGNVKIVANSGSINLNNVNVFYNNVPIQGQDISGHDNYGSFSGKRFPTFVLIYFNVVSNDENNLSPNIFSGLLPWCSKGAYTVAMNPWGGTDDIIFCNMGSDYISTHNLKKGVTYRGTMIYPL